MSQLKLSREAALKDGRKVRLRTYQPSDLDALVLMYATLSEETLRWSLPPYDRQKIERLTSDLPNKIILLALSEDRVVGHLLITVFPSQRFKGIGELIIYIHQEFQNIGLGAAMIAEAVSLARMRGLHRIGLSVIADNQRAIGLYEKMGFLKEGVRRHSYFGMDGVYHDSVDMGLLL